MGSIMYVVGVGGGACVGGVGWNDVVVCMNTDIDVEITEC